MSNPSPFDIGRQVGNNFAKVGEQNAIESILSEAMKSNDPEMIQNSIGKILSQVSPERQGVAIKLLQSTADNIRKREASNKYGIDPNLPAGVQTAIYRENEKGKRIANADKIFNQRDNQSPQPHINGQVNPGEFPVPSEQPQINNRQKKDQLLNLTGHPDREVSERAKAELKELQKDETENRADTRQNRKEVLQFHKESEKYDEDLFKQTKIAKANISTLENITKAVNSGNIKPSSLASIFKGFGKIGDKFSEALLNKDQSTLLTSIPQLLEGWKEVFGVRLTDSDLKLLQDKLPSIGKNKAANLAVIKILKKYGETALLRSEISSEIKEKNKGLRPLGYQQQIETRFDEMTKPVKIINPNNGKEIEIPAYKLSDAIKAGGKLVNE